MTKYELFTLAAVQAAPVYFDREASTEKACRLIRDAAEQGAMLAAFGETWIPGYPFFHGNRDANPGLYWKAAAEYMANAVEIPSRTTDLLCRAAAQSKIDVVIGIAELDARTKGTVYATLLFISREGEILGRNRKLKPTASERAIWGDGDAHGLHVYQRPYGRVSGLNCWEHNMVLPGYVLMAQGTQIHVAAFPGKEPAQAPPSPIAVWPRQLLLSRAFASQAGCYVILAGGLRTKEAVPDLYQDLATPSTQFTGDSYIIDPRGEIIAGPAVGETILLAEGSMHAVFSAKAGCNVTGHYSRRNIFQLLIEGQPVISDTGSESRHAGTVAAPSSIQSASGSFEVQLIEVDYKIS